jgi:Transposase zinc-ribbon domain
MCLSTCLDRFRTEAQCREVLFQPGWPSGFQRPACGSRSHCRLDTRDLLQCNRCKHQVSLTCGTLFAQTKLPLMTWFLAIYLLSQHENGISTVTSRRQLGVSYNMAWLLKHTRMQAMVESEHDRMLHGVVQMDDAPWGGERHGGLRGGHRQRPSGSQPWMRNVGNQETL